MDGLLLPQVDKQTVISRPTVLNFIDDAFSIIVPSRKNLKQKSHFLSFYNPLFIDYNEVSESYTINPSLVIKVDSNKSCLKSSLLSRINELSLIEKTDSEDRACALSNTVKNFSIQMICTLADVLLIGWTLFPDVNGALRMDYKTKDISSSISIGNDGFSWFVKSDNNFEMKDFSELSLSEIKQCLAKVSELAAKTFNLL